MIQKINNIEKDYEFMYHALLKSNKSLWNKDKIIELVDEITPQIIELKEIANYLNPKYTEAIEIVNKTNEVTRKLITLANILEQCNDYLKHKDN